MSVENTLRRFDGWYIAKDLNGWVHVFKDKPIAHLSIFSRWSWGFVSRSNEQGPEIYHRVHNIELPGDWKQLYQVGNGVITKVA